MTMTKPLQLLLGLILVTSYCIHETIAIQGSPHQYREQQPDGTTTPPLSVKGGPSLHYVTDSKGYTVVEDENHWFVYAKDAADGSGRLSPTGVRVGRGNPEKKGIHQGLIPAGEARAEQCGRLCDYYDDDGNRRLQREQDATAVAAATISGELKNLVVLMRFADHQERTIPSREDIDILMNSVGGDPSLAPTGSVRDVYAQSSYNQLTVDSTVYQWVTLPQTEHYYADDQNGFSNVFVEALHDALEIIDQDPNFSFSDFDVDDDGTIDAITFVHSGYGAEWSSTDCYGSSGSQRIWSHKWTMPSRLHWYSSDNVRVNKYHVSPAVWGTCGSNIGRIGVIAHELGHFLGLPDLYDGSGGEGVGSWDLMANSWGFDGSQRYPPILSSWCKIQLGWATPTILSASGTYSLSPWATTPDVYRIDEGFPSGEYLLIENRQKIGFDAKVPQAGLTIFHIDENAPRNDEGYPGQEGWPKNGKHYKVALLQADGNYDLEMGNGRGDGGDTWHTGASIGPSAADIAGPYPNTDAYQGGQIVSTGIRISNVSSPQVETMSFRLSFGDDDDLTEPPAPLPTPAPTVHPPPPTGDELVTTFAGGNGQAGNMFDIVAVETIDITRLALHTVSTSTVNVEVWTKSGSHVGHEDNPAAWTQVASVSVLGQGIGNRTPLPPTAFTPIRVPASQRRAFYVTLTTPDIRYCADGVLGDVYKSNDDLKLFVGTGLKYPFGSLFSPRVWNGALTYEVIKEPTTSPSASPTEMPSYWSNFPSMLPSAAPSSSPSASPTKEPTAKPTPLPTAAPTPKPTPSPTAKPTLSPTESPTPLPTQVPTAVPVPTSTLSTPLDSSTGQAGNMFDIVPTKDLFIVDMSIHTSATTNVTVEIWTKKGSYQKHERKRKSWRKVATATALGQGEGQLTPLSKDAFPPIAVGASETQAFYITLTTAEMRYSRGLKQGETYVSNDDLSLLVGVGKAYPFKATFKPRPWNGQIKYALADDPKVNIPTPMPTSAPVFRDIQTTMDGGNGQAGNMFDIRAINTVDIHGITHIHTSSTDIVDVEVWTKVGTYRGNEKNELAWMQIASVSVQGSGKDRATELPPNIFDHSIRVNAGEIQAFYVTLTTAEIRYTNGKDLGRAYTSTADLQILQGVGNVYPFKQTYAPRLWNGGLTYSIRANNN